LGPAAHREQHLNFPTRGPVAHPPLAPPSGSAPILAAMRNGDSRELTAPHSARPQAERAAARRLAGVRRAATRLDGNTRWIAATRRLRSRLPGDARFGDPLSIAGQAPVEVIARGMTTLRAEPDSLFKEIGLAGLQVWQSLSEAAG